MVLINSNIPKVNTHTMTIAARKLKMTLSLSFVIFVIPLIFEIQ